MIRDTVIIGADRFETAAQKRENARTRPPDLSIGDGSVIERAILDKDCRIGRGVKLINAEQETGLRRPERALPHPRRHRLRPARRRHPGRHGDLSPRSLARPRVCSTPVAIISPSTSLWRTTMFAGDSHRAPRLAARLLAVLPACKKKTEDTGSGGTNPTTVVPQTPSGDIGGYVALLSLKAKDILESALFKEVKDAFAKSAGTAMWDELEGQSCEGDRWNQADQYRRRDVIT